MRGERDVTAAHTCRRPGPVKQHKSQREAGALEAEERVGGGQAEVTHLEDERRRQGHTLQAELPTGRIQCVRAESIDRQLHQPVLDRVAVACQDVQGRYGRQVLHEGRGRQGSALELVQDISDHRGRRRRQRVTVGRRAVGKEGAALAHVRQLGVGAVAAGEEGECRRGVVQVLDERASNAGEEKLPPLGVVPQRRSGAKRKTAVGQKGGGAAADLEPWVYTPSAADSGSHS